MSRSRRLPSTKLDTEENTGRSERVFTRFVILPSEIGSSLESNCNGATVSHRGRNCVDRSVSRWSEVSGRSIADTQRSVQPGPWNDSGESRSGRTLSENGRNYLARESLKADVAKVTREEPFLSPVSEAASYLRGIIIPAVSRIVVARSRAHTDALRTYFPTCNVIAVTGRPPRSTHREPTVLAKLAARATEAVEAVEAVEAARPWCPAPTRIIRSGDSNYVSEKDRRPAIRERYRTPGWTSFRSRVLDKFPNSRKIVSRIIANASLPSAFAEERSNGENVSRYAFGELFRSKKRAEKTHDRFRESVLLGCSIKNTMTLEL